jgi:hypothetical protein
MTDQTDSNYGYFAPNTPAHEQNVQQFTHRQILGRISTMKLVKVLSCTSSGALAAAGTVNVQPLVNQVDGIGNQQAHGTAYNLQYFRAQSGGASIIMDPVAGDIGFAVIADRDTSAAIAAKGVANPGSSRRFSMSDGVYLGGILNISPNFYLRAFEHGIELGYGTAPIVVRITDDPKVILGNPNKPLYQVDTEGGPSTVVYASLVA